MLAFNYEHLFRDGVNCQAKRQNKIWSLNFSVALPVVHQEKIQTSWPSLPCP